MFNREDRVKKVFFDQDERLRCGTINTEITMKTQLQICDMIMESLLLAREITFQFSTIKVNV